MENTNLFIYEQARAVPDEAQKEIKGGRLAGMTDINPMWRIKKMTELFGPCGVGWATKNESYSLQSSPTGEVAVIYELDLIVKQNGEWSLPIKGIGGAMYIAKEKNGLCCDDEAFKKAKTDAFSVACKALGVGADVYFAKDKSKYDVPVDIAPTPTPTTTPTTQQAPKTSKAAAAKPTQTKPAQTKAPSKYQQVAALIKADTTDYWNLETVNEWITKRTGKDCRVNDLPDDVFYELLARMRGVA